MDPGNIREALIEAKKNENEGADIIMVKPALPYLDVFREVKNQVCCPVAAYQVSGEYAMIKAAAQNNWIDEKVDKNNNRQLENAILNKAKKIKLSQG